MSRHVRILLLACGIALIGTLFFVAIRGKEKTGTLLQVRSTEIPNQYALVIATSAKVNAVDLVITLPNGTIAEIIPADFCAFTVENTFNRTRTSIRYGCGGPRPAERDEKILTIRTSEAVSAITLESALFYAHDGKGTPLGQNDFQKRTLRVQ